MTSTPFTLTDPCLTPEALLISMALEGDNDAFAELIEGSRERCMRVALRLLRNRENAEDEVQNAFCKAYMHLNTFNQEARFCTWLVQIVINQCYMRLRGSQRSRPVPITLEGQDGEGDHSFEPVEWRNPEEILAVAQIHGLMQSELRKVPHLLRIPLELHVLEEIPLEEVARRLDTSVTAVKSRVFRGQRFLRDRMNQHCHRSGPGTLAAMN
jgi:RNA polymerase sigma-70 factor, ECF subfamily